MENILYTLKFMADEINPLYLLKIINYVNKNNIKFQIVCESEFSIYTYDDDQLDLIKQILKNENVEYNIFTF